MGIPHWDMLGSTMVTNNFIRLTPDRQSKMGAIWNNVVSLVLENLLGSLLCLKIYDTRPSKKDYFESKNNLLINCTIVVKHL